MARGKITRANLRAAVMRPKRGRRKKIAPVPELSEADFEFLLMFVANLRGDLLKGFLKDHDLPVSGPKLAIAKRLKDAIDEGKLAYGALIDLLDEVEPWGKQHVYLMTGPEQPGSWIDADWVGTHLLEHGVAEHLNAPKPLLLPPVLELASIIWSPDALRVTSIERRTGLVRDEDRDDEDETEDGDEVHYRAYVQRTTRGMIIFDWDFASNTAFLQITQLPSQDDYESAQARFYNLVGAWLPLHTFAIQDLRKAIVEFRRLNKAQQGNVRSHAVELADPDGRRVTGTSASAEQPLPGNQTLDTGMDNFINAGAVGHSGNFYFTSGPGSAIEPTKEMHFTLMGTRNRLNIMTPQSEPTIRYAIQRVRDACA